MSKSCNTIVVIGGGAAGMVAAIHAARAGGHVLLLERNQKVGRKLYITGKGRCNVTNHCSVQEALASVTRNARFLYSAMTRTPPLAIEKFYSELGVKLKVERGNRVFPQSDRASDIVDALFFELRRLGVPVLKRRATGISCKHGEVVAVQTDLGEIPCKAIILATGGLSYPATGSTGDGYKIATALGHTIVDPEPSLVPLESPDPVCGLMQGLSLKNVTLTVKTSKNKIVFKEQGELLFTHFGLSGPLVLSASARMHHFEQEHYVCFIDLKPALNEQVLDLRLVRELNSHANQDMSNVLGALLPRVMIPAVLMKTGIPRERKAHDLTRLERRNLLERLKAFPIEIKGKRPIDEAIVTSGGVNVEEVDPKTMASKLAGGLFFAGEILDVDAFTGGFNLQIAWSTGCAAGLGAAAFVNKTDPT